MGIELAIFAAMAATSVAQGIEEQKAGKAAKSEADKAAKEERAVAAGEAAIAAEEQHETLVEGRYAHGSLMAAGAAGGISTKSSGAGLGSLGTLGARIQGDVRRKMSLLQKRTNLSGVQRYQTANRYNREGRQAYKTGMRASYLSFAKAGMYSFAGYSSLGAPSTVTSSPAARGFGGGGSQQTSWGSPYIPR